MADKNNTKKDRVSFSVSLATDLNQKIEDEAAANKRSKNLQVNWIVEKHYESIAVQDASVAGREN